MTAPHFLLWWCNKPKAYATNLQCTKDWKYTLQAELEQLMVLSCSEYAEVQTTILSMSSGTSNLKK